MSEALRDAPQRQLVLKLLLSAKAENVHRLCARRRETSFAELNEQTARQLADLLAEDPSEGRSVGGAPLIAAAELGLVPSEPISGC